MNSDSIFYIGKSHHVCQDYALSGKTNKDPSFPYAIISDGCSSSPNTDWGSRFLVNAMEFEFNNRLCFDSEKVIERASHNIEKIDLHQESLDATLFAIWARQDYCCTVLGSGDGVVAYINTDGSIDVSHYEFPSGAPYYLSYSLNKDRSKKYLEKFGNLIKIKSFQISKEGIILKENIVNSKFLDWKEIDYEWPFNVNRPIVLNRAFNYKEQNIKAIIVMSDGVTSFMKQVITETSKTVEPVSLVDILKQLLAFKSYSGAFVQRRFQKFRKECEQLGWFHMDDISIGAVYLND